VPLLAQPADEVVLQQVPGMIGCNGYAHKS
jgi:hypothetical protein